MRLPLALAALCAVLATSTPAHAAFETMPADVTATVARHDAQLRRCYRRAHKIDPSLRGKLVVRFKVGARGRAVDVSFVSHQSTLHHTGVRRCVARVFRAMRFRPRGEPMWFRSPLVFAA
jgi:hypothetical protein